ncbi:hypothetical protein TorRG33x02_082950 [Trema orientale]|uniref:Uncharacterized protein n=1 Tax=Trema orientale TaxID=63057 RepID=A0A2P5FE23_TREOI|nr:hypothetical protein TorRG33x02_082950 [Trema orientale]
MRLLVSRKAALIRRGGIAGIGENVPLDPLLPASKAAFPDPCDQKPYLPINFEQMIHVVVYFHGSSTLKNVSKYVLLRLHVKVVLLPLVANFSNLISKAILITRNYNN